MSAHRTGRGIIGYFDTAEDATELVKRLSELGRAQLAANLIVTWEPCDVYRDAQGESGARARRGGGDRPSQDPEGNLLSP